MYQDGIHVNIKLSEILSENPDTRLDFFIEPDDVKAYKEFITDTSQRAPTNISGAGRMLATSESES